jgi:hypothetical protein
LSWLQSALPTSKHNKDILHQINKLCREIYAQRHLSVHVKQLDVRRLRDLAIIGWTDAAVGNRPDLSSTGGYIIGMASKEMLQGRRGYVNPLSWRSGKLPRIARSSLAAEVQSLAEGEQELMMLRFQWAEILGIPVDLRKPHLATCQVPNHINQKDSTSQQCKFTLYVKISWPNGTSHITNGLSLLPK